MTRSLVTLLTLAAMTLAAVGSTGANFSAVKQNGGNRYDAKPDWVPPAVALSDPGALLRGTISPAATASDAGSGVQSVTIDRSPAGGGTWTTVCTDTTSPYGCSLDTTAGATPDGLYDLRATAIDNGGNSAISATVANRRIDNTAPTSVSVTDPGANLRSTVTLGGAATDSGSGLATLAVQYKPSAGSTWTTACTASASPWTCSFDTTTVATPDGLYDLRVVATDAAGNATTSSAVTSRRIDNTAPTAVTMTDPAPSGFISGTKAFSGAASDTGGSGIASVRFQYRPSSGGLWLDACTGTTSPYGCSADTTLITDGLYDFQALATDNAGNTTASTIYTSRRIDNVAPTVTMNDPGAYLRQTVSLTAAAADGGGLANVVIQRRPNGGTIWTTVCTDTTSPYSCSLNTQAGATADGLYDFQAIATDNASRATTSAVVLARRIDNTAPTSATITNPGTPLSGTAATISGGGADAGSGVASVRFEYSPTGAGTWSTACVDTTSPYSCSFDTTVATDGLYDFHSVVTDNAGNTLTSATASPNSRIDNLPPAVTMTDPGAYLRGTITAGATASDASGIASVKIEYSVAGANSWTTACTDTTFPYSCAVNTTTLTSGGFYDFHAVATDSTGKVATSAIVSSRQVDNSVPAVTMNDPGTPITGTVTFTSTATDPSPGSGVASVQYQYFYLGFIWTTACTATTAPWSCTTATGSVPDGAYSWRAVATDQAGNVTNSATVASRTVDNTAPTVTMTDPGALGVSETLGATAADGSGAGVTSVTMQYKPSAGSTWTNVCTDTTSPYQCSFDTSGYTDGTSFDFRAIAVDGAGFSTTSAVQANKVVDKTAPTVTMTDPGTPFRASVTLASTPADAGSGIASVLYQYKLSAGSTWSTACTGAASPWSCSWDTTLVADGIYDVRAIATDGAGNQTTSAAVTSRTVDNTAPTAADVQAANGGSTAGKIQQGDSITFTYSEAMAPASIVSGWTGTSRSVIVHVDDITQASKGLDRLSVWDTNDTTLINVTADPTGLNGNGVHLNGDYVSANTSFNATMVMSGSTVTVTLGTLRSGTVNVAAAAAATMTWYPSGAATDLAGNPGSTTTRDETGTADVDF
jgi:hypothetical protein